MPKKYLVDKTVIDSVAVVHSLARGEGKWVLLVTILGSGMAFIDSTAMNVVLPVLQLELNATIPQMQWIVEAYAIFMSSLMLLGGALGDKFGRKRMFAVGVVIFSLASIWCGVAPGTGHLIVARAFQGVGGALLVPGSLAIVNVSFSEKERGRAIGTWSAFTAITTALGPILGGWLAQNLSWRLVFFINVPLSIVVLAALFFRIPETKKDNGEGKLDLPGSLFATLSLGCIVYALIESGNSGFGHAKVIVPFVAGGLSLVAFLYHEYRTPSPMMPLSLFRSMTFSGANIVSALFWAAWVGGIFFVPFNLIQIQGYTAAGVGIAFIPLVLALFLFSRWAGGLVGNYGARPPIIAGTFLAGVGCLLFTRPDIGGSYWTTFFPAIVTLGVGMAVTISPLTTAVMSSVNMEHSGIASAINNTVGRIAGLLSIAILGVFALSTFNNNLDRELAVMNLQPDTVQAIDSQRIKLAAIDIPEDLPAGTKIELRRVISESFLGTFRTMMEISAALLFAGSIVSWLTIGRLKPG